MRLVPHAAEVLKVLVRKLKPREIAVSSYGIREGLLYEQMSEALKARDPLIEAARHSEGAILRGCRVSAASFTVFVEPLFPRARPDRSA